VAPANALGMVLLSISIAVLVRMAQDLRFARAGAVKPGPETK
jgi:hypothetical protein